MIFHCASDHQLNCKNGISTKRFYLLSFPWPKNVKLQKKGKGKVVPELAVRPWILELKLVCTKRMPPYFSESLKPLRKERSADGAVVL